MYIPPDQIWIIAVGFVIAFILAFGIGANDVANSFGTSVGSKVISLKNACILASIFEVLGSILIGAQVSDTIRKGVISPEDFVVPNGTSITKVMMIGQLSSLTGACIWLLVATFFKLPVSGSHSIVGAILGFALVSQGPSKIQWIKLALIVASWFISPVISGLVSVMIFFIFDKFILRKRDPLEPGLRLLPYIYGITVFINIFSIFLSGPKLLKFDKVPLYGIFIISIGVFIITALIVRFKIVPYLRKTITRNEYLNSLSNSRNVSNPKSSSDRISPKNHTNTHLNDFKMKTMNSSTHESRDRNSNIRKNQSLNKRRSLPLSSGIRNHYDQRMLMKRFNDEKRGGILSKEIKLEEVDKVKSKKEHLNNTENHQDPSAVAFLNNNGKDQLNIDVRRQNGNNVEMSDNSKTQSSMNSKRATIISSVSSNNSCQIDVQNHCIEDGASPKLKSVENKCPIADKPQQVAIFTWLQILTAIFGSFAHGGNDVSNAIGPLVGLWILAVTQDIYSTMDVPVWILFYGGLGIIVGLWVWGRRVMKTIGTELTTITPSSGVSIELGSAITVLVASNIGIPISSTHCKVGSIVAVGRYRSNDNVNWKVFVNIVSAWLITLPFSGGLSALAMFLLSMLK